MREGIGREGASPGTNAGSAKVRRGLYARAFAWMMAHAGPTTERLYGTRKTALFRDLAEHLPPGGAVLEIGAGAGPTARYLPRGARWVAVEPNGHFHPHLKRAARRHGLDLELRGESAEALGLPDGSVDAAVSTLVLCSVRDPQRALAEIRRVLKPGGRLYLIEHVAAPRGTPLRAVQRLFRRPWGWLGDGCRPDRETGPLVEAAGFAWLLREPFDGPPGIVRPHLMGVARKA